MTTPILEFRDVCFSYEDRPHALCGVSLAVHRGERVAVLGGNGAGKSTFFLHCNGVLSPSSGQVLYENQLVTHHKKDLIHLRSQVGIVFQDPNQQLIASTVEGEVSFGPVNLRLSPEEVSRRVESALFQMGLTAFRHRPPHYLSGGEKNRVAVAGVLAMEPEVLLFDEPTASLDAQGGASLEQILASLHQAGKTLLVSTHDLDFVWRWADRAVVFQNGSVVADDRVEAVFQNDELLAQTGLVRPALLDTARLLQRKGLLPACALPRTLGELEGMLPAALSLL